MEQDRRLAEVCGQNPKTRCSRGAKMRPLPPPKQMARITGLRACKGGWNAACQRFPRELVVKYEWNMNPVLWTYITIHTLVGQKVALESNALEAAANRQCVLVPELDEGICRALCWSVNQPSCAISESESNP